MKYVTLRRVSDHSLTQEFTEEHANRILAFQEKNGLKNAWEKIPATLKRKKANDTKRADKTE